MDNESLDEEVKDGFNDDEVGGDDLFEEKKLISSLLKINSVHPVFVK